MQILEGYAVLAYDFRVEAAKTDCLLRMLETVAEKEARWAREAEARANEGKFLRFIRLFGMNTKAAFDRMPPLPTLGVPTFDDLI